MSQNETHARAIINKLLAQQGWNVIGPNAVRFEGMQSISNQQFSVTAKAKAAFDTLLALTFTP